MMDCDVKSDSSPERAHADDDAKGSEVTNGNKKRKRKPYRPGVLPCQPEQYYTRGSGWMK